MNVAMNMEPPVVALIAGPTASGKSALAVALAERIGGIVVNADASQLYRDLRILSARPTAEEEARVPHRLFGTQDAAEPASAAAWARLATAQIDAAHAAGRVPILAGGTGLYLRTLLEGIAPVPEIDPLIRAEVRTLPVAEAHAALAREDPAAAARLRATDTTRIARALEVVRATQRTLADWQAAKAGGIGHRVHVSGTILLPPRAALHARIDERFEAMLAQGAIEEVQRLVARGLDPALPAMRAIGVAEIAAWLDGGIDRAALVERGTAATRQYAKRQYTWFRHQPPATWMRSEALIDRTNLDEHAIMLQTSVLTRSFMSPISTS